MNLFSHCSMHFLLFVHHFMCNALTLHTARVWVHGTDIENYYNAVFTESESKVPTITILIVVNCYYDFSAVF